MYEMWYQLLFDNVMARFPGLSHYNSYLWIFPLWKIGIVSLSFCLAAFAGENIPHIIVLALLRRLWRHLPFGRMR